MKIILFDLFGFCKNCKIRKTNHQEKNQSNFSNIIFTQNVMLIPMIFAK